MQQMKQGVSKATPCILLDSTDFKTAETGVAYGSVTCSYRKEGATSWSTKSLSGKWTEVGGGVYLITWDDADLDTVGRFDYMCVSSGCLTYYGALQVVANLPDDIAALVTTVDGVVDGIAAAIAGLNDLSAADVLAAITTDNTKFAGALIANLNATVSSRSSHSAADVVALLNDLNADEIAAAVWDALKSAHTTEGSFGDYLDSKVSEAGPEPAPTVVEIAEAVHDIKLTFDKETGLLTIKMADDTVLTARTVTDTETEVTRA